MENSHKPSNKRGRGRGRGRGGRGRRNYRGRAFKKAKQTNENKNKNDEAKRPKMKSPNRRRPHRGNYRGHRKRRDNQSKSTRERQPSPEANFNPSYENEATFWDDAQIEHDLIGDLPDLECEDYDPKPKKPKSAHNKGRGRGSPRRDHRRGRGRSRRDRNYVNGRHREEEAVGELSADAPIFVPRNKIITVDLLYEVANDSNVKLPEMPTEDLAVDSSHLDNKMMEEFSRPKDKVVICTPTKVRAAELVVENRAWECSIYSPKTTIPDLSTVVVFETSTSSEEFKASLENIWNIFLVSKPKKLLYVCDLVGDDINRSKIKIVEEVAKLFKSTFFTCIACAPFSEGKASDTHKGAYLTEEAFLNTLHECIHKDRPKVFAYIDKNDNSLHSHSPPLTKKA